MRKRDKSAQEAKASGTEPEKAGAADPKADDRSPAEVSKDQAVPGAETADSGTDETTNLGTDRSVVIGQGLQSFSKLALRLLVIGVFLVAVLYLIGQFWVAIFPILMALIVSTVLWPPTRWLRSKKFPPALAAASTLLIAFGLLIGAFVAMAPTVVDQAGDLGDKAVQGIDQMQEWVSGPPLNIDDDQIEKYTSKATDWIQKNSQEIAGSALSGVGLVTNGVVNFFLILLLTFFFIKDGPRFLPWLRQLTGRGAGRHLTEVASRSWNTLGGFIRAQAAVSGFDATFIGVGLLILGVPLALPLAFLTFLGGFIPIIGALAVGALAVLVALVSKGLTTALLVLGLILLVQQIEGNLLQPWLQGKSMQLHAGIILLAVTVGGTLFGIAGAFLAVPVAATSAVLIRYVSEQINLRTGDLKAEDVPVVTTEGRLAAEAAEREAVRYGDPKLPPTGTSV